MKIIIDDKTVYETKEREITENQLFEKEKELVAVCECKFAEILNDFQAVLSCNKTDWIFLEKLTAIDNIQFMYDSGDIYADLEAQTFWLSRTRFTDLKDFQLKNLARTLILIDRNKEDILRKEVEKLADKKRAAQQEIKAKYDVIQSLIDDLKN